MVIALSKAAGDLNASARSLHELCGTLRVPKPRPRRMQFAPDLYWPLITPTGEAWFTKMVDEAKHAPGMELTVNDGEYLAKYILNRLNFSPRKAVQALRRMQAARAWCEARCDGLLRDQENSRRSQRRYMDIIEAEAAAASLGKPEEPF
jgi:hypothetical protein